MKKFFDLTTNEAWQMLIELIKEAGLEPRLYTIFRETGGWHYVVRQLTSELYLSDIPIKQELREKFINLNKAEKLFAINDRIEEASDWEKERLQKEKNKILEERGINA